MVCSRACVQWQEKRRQQTGGWIIVLEGSGKLAESPWGQAKEDMKQNHAESVRSDSRKDEIIRRRRRASTSFEWYTAMTFDCLSNPKEKASDPRGEPHLQKTHRIDQTTASNPSPCMHPTLISRHARTSRTLLIPDLRRTDQTLPRRLPQCAIDSNIALAVQIQVPVEPATEDSTTHDIPQQSGDDALPDVKADGQSRRALPDAHGDEEHVGDHVVEAEGDKGKDGPPDARDLGDEFAARGTEEAGQTDEPVGADAAEEDLVPARDELFFRGEEDGFGVVGFAVEDSAVCGRKRGGE